jgi:SAM-dependent methyltransferase
MTESPAQSMEYVACNYCGSRRRSPFLTAEDDLTGKPGRFSFVLCDDCGLVYQHPRLGIETVKSYYDDEYIAHRKNRSWGLLKGCVERAMDRLDRNKVEIVKRYINLDEGSEVLDVGCGAGTFLAKLLHLYGAKPTGVDFIDLGRLPVFEKIDFHCGLFYDLVVGSGRFDLVSMWHLLEHDYDPHRSLSHAREALKPNGRLVIEVPRLDSLSYRLYGDRWPGLQAPQHTVLFTKDSLFRHVAKAGLEVVDYLAYGAYPAYFYLFAGAAFKMLKGQGLNLEKVVLPYFLGQVLLSPVLLFERQLNLSMQTVVCRRAP